MKYRVENTQTGEVYSEAFATVEEAEAEMYRQFPVVTPWDGVEVNVAVAVV